MDEDDNCNRRVSLIPGNMEFEGFKSASGKKRQVGFDHSD